MTYYVKSISLSFQSYTCKDAHTKVKSYQRYLTFKKSIGVSVLNLLNVHEVRAEKFDLRITGTYVFKTGYNLLLIPVIKISYQQDI